MFPEVPDVLPLWVEGFYLVIGVGGAEEEVFRKSGVWGRWQWGEARWGFGVVSKYLGWGWADTIFPGQVAAGLVFWGLDSGACC